MLVAEPSADQTKVSGTAMALGATHLLTTSSGTFPGGDNDSYSSVPGHLGSCGGGEAPAQKQGLDDSLAQDNHTRPSMISSAVPPHLSFGNLCYLSLGSGMHIPLLYVTGNGGHHNIPQEFASLRNVDVTPPFTLHQPRAGANVDKSQTVVRGYNHESSGLHQDAYGHRSDRASAATPPESNEKKYRDAEPNRKVMSLRASDAVNEA